MVDFGRIINSRDGTPRGNIYLGDRTSHGGVVVSVSGHSAKADGMRNARIGDLTYCPRCKPHLFPIISADDFVRDWGVPVPRAGDSTECGALLIAEAVPREILLAAQRIVNFSDSGPYDQYFSVRDARTNKPLPNVAYRITLDDGRVYEGITDSSGLTTKVFSDSAQIATIEAPYYGDNTGTTDSNDGYDTCSC